MNLPLAGQWGSVCGFSCGQGLIGFGDLSFSGLGLVSVFVGLVLVS